MPITRIKQPGQQLRHDNFFRIHRIACGFFIVEGYTLSNVRRETLIFILSLPTVTLRPPLPGLTLFADKSFQLGAWHFVAFFVSHDIWVYKSHKLLILKQNRNHEYWKRI
jgi:hypothetical protein